MEHIYKSYGQAVVLQDFSYAFTPGGITCIMGESGAGKTTLLRLLMGLEKADSGIITGFDKVSAVFQENRLIEHLNAVENTALVIKDRNAGKCAYERAFCSFFPKLKHTFKACQRTRKRRHETACGTGAGDGGRQ
ncbi:MAG: ATP-binding cassette domain-containing protein [Lachnospira sp.]